MLCVWRNDSKCNCNFPLPNTVYTAGHLPKMWPNMKSVPNNLPTAHRTADCVVECKAIAMIQQLVLPCLSPLYFAVIFTVVFCIYMTIWIHNKPWPLPVTPCTSTDPCILHRPAPQIISRPVISVTAVGLPSDCTSKLKNQILTDHFTNRIFCLFGQLWCLYVVILRVWVSGYFRFHNRSLLYRQSEMWNCAAIYAHWKGRWWFLLTHKVWQFGIADRFIYCSLV